MKILCDVCDKDEAVLFCVADEAALCAACDHRVHHANKLAGKHQRFSLHHPSPKQAPLCDICQEKKAFLFCRQDRAILCRDCDLSIHKTNQHTQNHTRFLLTGLKLSPLQESANDVVVVSDVVLNKDKPSASRTDHQNIPEHNGGSSISEYLIDMLPGWHVEELLDSSFPYNGFCKSGDDNGLLPLWDDRVPESSPWKKARIQTTEMGFGAANIDKELKWHEDSSFVVPQMSEYQSGTKTFTTSFW